MTAAIPVIERFGEHRTILRAALLRGNECAVLAILSQCGARGATLLAWVALAARPGTALADRIDQAAESRVPSRRRDAPRGRGSALLDLIRGDDTALMAFSRGMAVMEADDHGKPANRGTIGWRGKAATRRRLGDHAHVPGGVHGDHCIHGEHGAHAAHAAAVPAVPAATLTRLAEWRRDDPASLSDFALVGLVFGGFRAMPEILDAVGDSAASLLLRTPRLSRRTLAQLMRRRPHVVAGFITLLRESSPASPASPASPTEPVRDPRIVDLLHELAMAAPGVPVGSDGRTAMQRLARIARDRDELVHRDQRGPAIAALDSLEWAPVFAVAGEALAAGFLGVTEQQCDPFRDPSPPPRCRSRRRVPPPSPDRRLTIDEGAAEAVQLLELLADHRSPEALDHVERAGRTHRLPIVRREALARLIAAAGDARRPAPPGRALALARAQLGDPIGDVALPALDHLRVHLPPAELGAAVFRAIPRMSLAALDRVATRLAWELPIHLHPAAVRRLVDSYEGGPLLKFLVSASHRTRGADHSTAVEPDDPPTPAPAPATIDVAERESIDQRVDAWFERLESWLQPLVSGDLPRRIRWWSGSDTPIDEGLPANGWSAHARGLLRLAARQLGRTHRMRVAAARIVRQEAYEGHRTSGEAPSIPAPSAVSSGHLLWTILHALRHDRVAVRLRTQLLLHQVEHLGLLGPMAAIELIGMRTDPATAAVLDLDRWRAQLRTVLAHYWDDPTALLRSCTGLSRPRGRFAPWLAGEIVAVHAASPDPGDLAAIDVASATTDPEYDRSFRTSAPVGSSSRVARCPSITLQMHQHLRGVIDWLEREGERLLQQPVIVRLATHGAGHTCSPAPGESPTIHVSPDPMIDLGASGAQVMLGVGIHEFGHQLYDYREPGHLREHRRLQRLGLAALQNLLCDERLERRLRSLNRHYGTLLDVAIRHHFHRQVVTVPLAGLAALSGRNIGELRSAITGGILPKANLVGDREAECEEVRVPGRELLRLPGLGTPWQVFMWGLRTGIAPADIPCGRARAALALVPADLKDLNLRQVGGLCERVAEALGGVEDERARRAAMRRMHEEEWHLAAVLRAIDQAVGGGWADLSEGEDHDDGDDESSMPHRVPTGGAGDASGHASVRRRLRARRMQARLRARHGAPELLDADADPEPIAPLPHERHLPRDPAAHRTLVESVRPHVAVLKRAFDQLGVRAIDDPASRRGHRLDVARARRTAIAPCPNVLVSRREVLAADCHLGILIDRSGSMHGPKIHQARCFGAMVAEAARGNRGIDGWVAAFDDDTWYDLGGFRDTAVASLEAGGGNNDASALFMAGQRMQHSRRRRRVLVLISDGEPSECSVAAFHGEAARLERDHGIAVVHVVVEQMCRAAVLPRHVDLASPDHEDAVRQFTRVVTGLVRSGRRAVAAAPAVPVASGAATDESSADDGEIPW